MHATCPGRPRTSSSRPTSRSRPCGGDSPKRASSRCPCGRTATRALRRCSCRRWRSGSRSSSRARRRSPRATGSSTARTAASWRRGTRWPSSARVERCAGRRVPRPRARLERQSDGRAGAHVGAVRRSDRGASSRRSLSTAAISVGISLKPTGSRCAASSARVHGAHSCISTKSSLDSSPGLGRRSEHDPALLALGVHLDDQTRAADRAPQSPRGCPPSPRPARPAVPTSYCAQVSGGCSECAQDPSITRNTASPRSAPTAVGRIRQSAPRARYAAAARSRSSRFAVSGSNEMTVRAPCASAWAP